MKRVGFVAVAVAGLLTSTTGQVWAAGSWTEEPVPARESAYSLFDTTASGDGTTWAFGGWYPVPGHPRFHSQAYLRGAQGWQEVPVPDIGRLSGSAVVARDDAWSVGQGANYGQNTAVHWDGRLWTEVPLAPPPARHRLQMHEMVAFGPDVWAVGDLASDDPSSPSHGVVQNWDGKAWADVPMPVVAGTWSLAGIGGIASNDLWAVGRTEGEPGQGVAMHWDGQRWKQAPVPAIEGSPTQDVMLHGVAALAADDVWASGTLRSYGDEESSPIMMHWDGTRWTVAEIPIATGELGDLVRAGDQMWALGSTVLRYGGATWTRVDGPSAGSPRAGTALDDGRLLTVGATGPSHQRQPFVSVHDE